MIVVNHDFPGVFFKEQHKANQNYRGKREGNERKGKFEFFLSKPW